MRRNKRVKTGELPKSDPVIRKISVPQGIPVEIPKPQYDEVPAAPNKQGLEKTR